MRVLECMFWKFKYLRFYSACLAWLARFFFFSVYVETLSAASGMSDESEKSSVVFVLTKTSVCWILTQTQAESRQWAKIFLPSAPPEHRLKCSQRGLIQMSFLREGKHMLMPAIITNTSMESWASNTSSRVRKCGHFILQQFGVHDEDKMEGHVVPCSSTTVWTIFWKVVKDRKLMHDNLSCARTEQILSNLL